MTIQETNVEKICVEHIPTEIQKIDENILKYSNLISDLERRKNKLNRILAIAEEP